MPEPDPVATVTVYNVPLPETAPTEEPTSPVAVRPKSAALTPVTISLKVTVKSTFVAAVGLAPARFEDTTAGAVLSIVCICPAVKFPSPIEAPPNGFPAARMVLLSATSSRSVPDPVPVLTATV